MDSPDSPGGTREGWLTVQKHRSGEKGAKSGLPKRESELSLGTTRKSTSTKAEAAEVKEDGAKKSTEFSQTQENPVHTMERRMALVSKLCCSSVSSSSIMELAMSLSLPDLLFLLLRPFLLQKKSVLFFPELKVAQLLLSRIDGDEGDEASLVRKRSVIANHQDYRALGKLLRSGEVLCQVRNGVALGEVCFSHFPFYASISYVHLIIFFACSLSRLRVRESRV